MRHILILASHIILTYEKSLDHPQRWMIYFNFAVHGHAKVFSLMIWSVTDLIKPADTRWF